MNDAVAPARLPYSDHLVHLLGRSEAAAARIAGADPDRRAPLAAAARREAARRSVRLDASPLDDDIADEVDRRLAEGLPAIEDRPGAPVAETSHGGWGQALKLEGMPTHEVAAVEYSNALAAHAAEAELASRLFARPLEVLGEAHGLLCDGLVAPEVIGRPRLTEQAMHDGAQGRVLYTAPPPHALPGLLAALEGWLGEGSATLPAVVVAGVVHERLLQWLPYEAANGRLARLTARLVLRARGIDPQGIAVPERGLSDSPLAYYSEVAATIRRRGDLGPWLERWAEVVCAALEEAAGQVDPVPQPVLPARARTLAETLRAGQEITLTEHSTAAGISREVALAELRQLERAGALRAVAGGHGLRWTRSEQTEA